MIKVTILHAGINHPSPFIHSLCMELDKYNDIEYEINPTLTSTKSIYSYHILYFHRLKRYYDSNNMNSGIEFINNIKNLKMLGYKIAWTIHNFLPIDRRITEVDEYVLKHFLNLSDCLFTLTNYMKKSLKNNFEVDSIMHSIGVNTLDGWFDKDTIDLSFLPDNAFLITFVGNVAPYKQIQKIIDYFNQICNDNTYLLIAGQQAKNIDINLNINNDNIIRYDKFVGASSWDKICEKTNVFINLYDLDYDNFKYGFFPSNSVTLSQKGIKVITPNSEIINELLPEEARISFNFNDDKTLLESMKNSINQNEKLVFDVNNNISNKYSWANTTKIVVESFRNLFRED